MNKLLIILILFSASSFICINAQEVECIRITKSFKKGDTAYLFGDNVRLREAPSSESETLKLLKIGSTIEIIEKSNEKDFYKGIENYWYKVKYNGKEGYILGGLISNGLIEQADLRCLVSLEKTDRELYTSIRVFSNSGEYFENNSAYGIGGGDYFCIGLYDNKGLPEVNNILYLRHYGADSCGSNEGGYYLFFDQKKLHKVLDVYSGGGEGSFTDESLIFPSDSLGIKNKIIYVRRNEESEEDDRYRIWEVTSTQKLKLKLEWVDGKLKPDPKKFEINNYR